MSQFIEFYLDVLDNKGHEVNKDNLVEVELDLESDSFSHAFGVERTKTAYVRSVSLNGETLAGSQKNLVLALLGGEDKIAKRYDFSEAGD